MQDRERGSRKQIVCEYCGVDILCDPQKKQPQHVLAGHLSQCLNYKVLGKRKPETEGDCGTTQSYHQSETQPKDFSSQDGNARLILSSDDETDQEMHERGGACSSAMKNTLRTTIINSVNESIADGTTTIANMNETLSSEMKEHFDYQAERTAIDTSMEQETLVQEDDIGYEISAYASQISSMPLPVAVTDEIIANCHAVECFSETLDRTLSESSHSRDETLRAFEDEECMVEFWRMTKRYSLSKACQKDLIKFVNQYFVKDGEKRFRVQDIERTLDSLKINLIKPKRKKVYLAQGLLPKYPSGIPFELTYKDLLSVITRQVVYTLHQFGEEAFAIGLNSGCYENAQDGLFLRSVYAQLSAEDPLEAGSLLIAPFIIYADGAHMRANGLHHITPLAVSVVHREFFTRPMDAELVTVIPSLAKLMQASNEQDADFLDLTSHSSEVMASVCHGIAHYITQEVMLIVNRKLTFHIHVKGKRFRCYPVLLQKALDMPMMSNFSFTTNSMPMKQESPCPTCLAKGKCEEFYFQTGPARCEADTVIYCCGSGPSANARRKKESLRLLGRPMFSNMNPFDSRGAFLQAASDGLHSFKGLWFRKLTSMGIEAMYISSTNQPAIQQVRNETASTTQPWDSLYYDGEDTDNDDGEYIDWTEMAVTLQDEVETNIASNMVEQVASTGLMSIKDPPRRITNILKTKRGRLLAQAATQMNTDLNDRIGSSYIPLRNRTLQDQVTKLQEHTYSPGILLTTIALFSSDLSSNGLGQFRRLWLAAAVKVFLCYCKLFQLKPTDDTLQEAKQMLEDLSHKARDLAKAMKVPWNAPKIHCNLHFPESIAQLGRMRVFDTTTGESTMSFVKSIYQTISNRDISNATSLLLSKTEEYIAINMLTNKIHGTKADRSDQQEDSTRRASQNTKLQHLLQPDIEIFYRPRKVRGGKANEIFRFANDCYPESLCPHIASSKEFWIAVGRGMARYFESEHLFPDFSDRCNEWYKVKLTMFGTAVLPDGQRICATPSRYNKPQFDFADCTIDKDKIFARCLLFCRMSLKKEANSQVLFEREVAFINILSLHTSEELLTCHGQCQDVSPILLHGKFKRLSTGLLALKCIPISQLRERITAIRDRIADWKPDTNSMSFPNGEWYFILDPANFSGVEVYS